MTAGSIFRRVPAALLVAAFGLSSIGCVAVLSRSVEETEDRRISRLNFLSVGQLDEEEFAFLTIYTGEVEAGNQFSLLRLATWSSKLDKPQPQTEATTHTSNGSE